MKDHAAQSLRKNDALHHAQESDAALRPSAPFVLRILVTGHGESMLLHAVSDSGSVPTPDLISVALFSKR